MAFFTLRMNTQLWNRIMSGSIYICDKITASGWLDEEKRSWKKKIHTPCVYLLIGVSPHSSQSKHIGKRSRPTRCGHICFFSYFSFSFFAFFSRTFLYIFSFFFLPFYCAIHQVYVYWRVCMRMFVKYSCRYMYFFRSVREYKHVSRTHSVNVGCTRDHCIGTAHDEFFFHRDVYHMRIV